MRFILPVALLQVMRRVGLPNAYKLRGLHTVSEEWGSTGGTPCDLENVGQTIEMAALL
jgi:hypothetical protein